MKSRKWIYLLMLILIIANTSFSFAYWASLIEEASQESNTQINIGSWDMPVTVSLFTDFEDVSKGSYATGSITTYGYSWIFNDALIGTLSSDLKNDSQSARLRTGFIQSEFSIKNLEKIRFYAGRFGTDSLGTFTIELSEDGINFEIYQSITVTSSLLAYEIIFVEQDVNQLGLSLTNDLYIRFRTTDSHRINIDDLDIDFLESANELLFYTEDFETAIKTAYASASISINGYNWYLNDTLIGTLNQDQKNGSRSIRLRNGYFNTEFRIANLNKLSFYVGNYNTQSQSANLFIEVSTNGSTWYTVVSNITTTASFVLYELNINNALLSPFGLSVFDPLYIRIGSNNNNRVNIDDITFEYYGSNNFNV